MQQTHASSIFEVPVKTDFLEYPLRRVGGIQSGGAWRRDIAKHPQQSAELIEQNCGGTWC